MSKQCTFHTLKRDHSICYIYIYIYRHCIICIFHFVMSLLWIVQYCRVAQFVRYTCCIWYENPEAVALTQLTRNNNIHTSQSEWDFEVLETLLLCYGCVCVCVCPVSSRCYSWILSRANHRKNTRQWKALGQNPNIGKRLRTKCTTL